MDWRSWRTHFEENARRPLPLIENDVPPAWRACLVHSLARFQIGETGEGRIAHQIRRLGRVDEDYCAALALFVREEGRHARILAEMVRALGGTLLRETWTRRLFAVRRLIGVRGKLLVLLAAEVIGIGFYAMLAGALPGPSGPPGDLQARSESEGSERLPLGGRGRGTIRAALEQIARDEDFHLRFHCDFFRAQALPAWLFRPAWWLVGSCAAIAVLWDHRRTLDAIGVGRREAARRLFALVARADRAVTGPLLPAAAPAAS